MDRERWAWLPFPTRCLTGGNPMESLQELFEEQLKDLYSAENQLLKAMPRMANKLSSEKLVQAFEMHRKQTEQQVERLARIGKDLDIKLTGKVCAAMKGLIEE